MVFLSICRALYDYSPQGEGELSIREGELVYILEKSTEDDWWKAKKKAGDEDVDEPVGLIPNNYVEEATPIHQAKALYDYSRQTEEELSFSEDAALLVYDISDPDWTLVGFDGEYGFAPSNYIEITGEAERPTSRPTAAPTPSASALRAPEPEPEQESPPESPPATSPASNPAANLASIINRQASSTYAAPQSNVQFTPDASDDEAPPPSLPQRPISQQPASPPPRQTSPPRRRSPPSPEPAGGVIASPSVNRVNRSLSDAQVQSPGGYHLYNINEMVSVMGKQKKMPTTLGINLATGVILIIPEKKRDGPQQEWTADKLKHYAIEGKHVFIDLVQPSKSVDFHAGAKDTANEIVSSLGELAGMYRAEGLMEVITAGTGARGQKKGHMLYDFMAQGEDEVTVADGDEVIILDDHKSEEWWKVRRIKNGKEGVVPSSYVEVTGLLSPSVTTPSTSGINAGRSVIEQNRLEEERLAREAAARDRKAQEDKDVRTSEVGPGLKLPSRASSLQGVPDSDTSGSSQRSKRDSRSDNKSGPAKSKPDLGKVRTWTDRSGSFKVEAQFIGLKDGKIHLHKLNGVKIAVPVAKMATEDLEYVENVTGISLDDDKPISDIIKKSQKVVNGDGQKRSKNNDSAANAGASVQKKPEYDWFDFFLKCGVSPYQCERYSYSFNKDSMDETVLADITPAVLRNLGLKEGDILRVMKFLDTKYGRTGGKSKLRNVSFGGEEVMGNDDEDGTPSGGLFAGPGGALRNNTRKGRPAAAVQTNNTVDSKVFQQQSSPKDDPISERRASPDSPPPPKPPSKDTKGSFDDDAWDVKPARQTTRPSQQATPGATPASGPTSGTKPSTTSQPALTGAMVDLLSLSEPLQPIVTHTTGVQQPPPQPPPQQQPPQPQQPFPQQPLPQMNQFQMPQQQIPVQPTQQAQAQPQGANPQFFSQLGSQPTGQAPQQYGMQPHLPQVMAQPTGQFQINPGPRQRPQAPQMMSQQNMLSPPPPPRPLSAPQNASPQSNFGPPPLQPQLTGAAGQGGFQNPITSPTQTLNDLNKFRLQQQMVGQQPPFQPQSTGWNSQGQLPPQFTGAFGQQPQNMYQNQLQPQATGMQSMPYLMGQQTGSPFADPRNQSMQPQMTGFAQPPFNSLMPQQTGSINSVLSPALQPQITGLNGFNQSGFGQAPPPVPQIPQQFGQSIPPPPPIPQQQTMAPLQPQKTGPAPHVKFGVGPDAKKLSAQPTGRRANLAQATPDNPFGF